jgi:hypothetical protein
MTESENLYTEKYNCTVKNTHTQNKTKTNKTKNKITNKKPKETKNSKTFITEKLTVV